VAGPSATVDGASTTDAAYQNLVSSMASFAPSDSGQASLATASVDQTQVQIAVNNGG